MGHEEELFHELFSGLPRLAPGLDRCTREALGFVPHTSHTVAADLGCGVGLSTLVLAEETGGEVTAIDSHEPYLASLRREAAERGLANRIRTVSADMAQPPIEPGSLDLLWAEGAIYILGFERGLELWKPLLKPAGWIAVTELTWLTDEPSRRARQFWHEAYPAMTSVAENERLLRAKGFSPHHHFVLPDEAWEDEYYTPLYERLAHFAKAHPEDSSAESIAAAVSEEIDIRRSHRDEFSYVFYIARLAD